MSGWNPNSYGNPARRRTATDTSLFKENIAPPGASCQPQMKSDARRSGLHSIQSDSSATPDVEVKADNASHKQDTVPQKSAPPTTIVDFDTVVVQADEDKAYRKSFDTQEVDSARHVDVVRDAKSPPTYLNDWMKVTPRHTKRELSRSETHELDPSLAPSKDQPSASILSNMSQQQQGGGSRTPVIPLEVQAGREMSRDEVLARARDEQLKKITLRNRAKDKDATTSLTDLDIARKPPKQRKTTTGLEHKVWPNDHPLENTPTAPVANVYWQQTPRSQSPAVNNHNYTAQVTHFTQPSVAPTESKGTYHQNVVSGHAGHTVKDINDIAQTFEALPDDTGTGSIRSENQHKSTGNPRWASKDDLKPIKADLEVDSNAWGSKIPTDASQASDDSMQPLHFGRLFRNKAPEDSDLPLSGWDGRIQPPPIDWNDRPRFNNNNPEFKDTFARWMTDVCTLTAVDPDVYFEPIPTSILNDIDWHPDGLKFVRRLFTISNEKQAARYGYEDPAEAIKYSQKCNQDEFEDWGKLDPSRATNVAIKDETTDDLVSNWIANTAQRRKLAEMQAETISKAKEVAKEYKAEPNPYCPVVNIYLRPAVKIDLPQMLAIYNWYVEHSVRTTEMHPIDSADMRARWDSCNSNKLPMIVAVMRNKASAKRIDLDAAGEMLTTTHPIKNIDSNSNIMMYEEKVVGWASATDFTASDYVERISAELEVFVESTYRQQGVGRCLMDKILESLDRGYIKRGGYPFHCAQEIRHLYSPGGGRDIHKIMVIVRKWKHPRNENGRLVGDQGGVSTDVRKLNDRENDYDHWLKEWLESWGFQVEGFLSGIGAKHGRFIDDVYLGRETMWQPADGRIPDPLPGTF